MVCASKKKIAYLIGTLQIGGAEWQMVDTVTRVNRQLFEPQVYCLFGGGVYKKHLDRHGVKVTIFNVCSGSETPKRLIPFWRYRAFTSLYRYLRRERPDIVHCYMYKPSIYGGIAAKLAGGSLIFTHRLRLGYFKDARPHYQLIENAVNAFITGIIVNSEAVRQDVLQRERTVPENVHVIHAGVDIDKYTPRDCRIHCAYQRMQQKKQWGLPLDVPVIGMVANLFRYKGYREFFLAAAAIRRDYPNAQFLCIGEDRGFQAELMQMIQHLHLQEHVIFTGEIQNISEILQILDIQVLASYEEGFSSAILEGMASGKPIVATSVGGTPEAILHNITGLLIPPRDPEALRKALKYLLDHPEFASELGRNARQRVQEYFSMEKTLEKLESLYQSAGKAINTSTLNR